MKIPLSKYAELPTEQQNPRTTDLDRIPMLKVIERINNEDQAVAVAVGRAKKEIARASTLAAEAFMRGGNIIFIGAGTSGRIGVLEAAECPPTFGIRPSRVIGIMAGGNSAVFLSKEGAEDIAENGAADVKKKLSGKDCVVGIAASGVTPYVMGALKVAKDQGCSTVLVTCSDKPVNVGVDVIVSLKTGPEVLCGSTRMKAGTATKLALNSITTAAMVASGKVYKNWMVDVRPTSRKLVARAQRLASGLGRIPAAKAARMLKATRYNVKAVIVMARLGVDYKKAVELLDGAKGFLKDVIE